MLKNSGIRHWYKRVHQGELWGQEYGTALPLQQLSIVLELLMVVGIEIFDCSSVVTSCLGSSPSGKENKEERFVAWSASWSASAL